MAFSNGMKPILAKKKHYITQYDDMDDPYLQEVDGRDLQQGSQVGTTSRRNSSTVSGLFASSTLLNPPWCEC